MQQHHLRPALTRVIATPVVLSFLAAGYLCAGCAPPTGGVAVGKIEGTTVLDGLFSFGLANRTCLGVEFDSDDLLRSPVRAQVAGSTPLEAVRKVLAAYPRYSVRQEGIVISVRPAARTPASWLDVRIDHFDGGKGPVQAVSHLLYMYLLDLVKPGRNYAGHFYPGDAGDVVGPIDVQGNTVRELLNLLVGSSKGGMWLTVAPYVRTHGDPDPFWKIIEYSDPRYQDGYAIRSIAREAGLAFAPASPEK